MCDQVKAMVVLLTPLIKGEKGAIKLSASGLSALDISDVQSAGKVVAQKNLSADYVQINKLEPGVAKFAKDSKLEIERLGLTVDKEAQSLAQESIGLTNKFSQCRKGPRSERMKILDEQSKLYDKIDEKGYDYIEGHTPIKLSMQSNEVLLKIAEKYKPRGGENGVYDMACKILAERGVVKP